MIYALNPSPPIKAKKISYGLICVSLSEGCVIINVNPPYITPLKRNKGHISLNWNQTYDLMLGATAYPEGTFSLPKGHKEKIDKQNILRTQVREFVEETGLYHPKFKDISKLEVYGGFTEEWVGLNNVYYSVEYSLFVINKMAELKRTKKSLINITQLLSLRKYRYNNRYDLLKQFTIIPIECLGNFINHNKYAQIRDINVDGIVKIMVEKYKYQKNNGLSNNFTCY